MVRASLKKFIIFLFKSLGYFFSVLFIMGVIFVPLFLLTRFILGEILFMEILKRFGIYLGFLAFFFTLWLFIKENKEEIIDWISKV